MARSRSGSRRRVALSPRKFVWARHGGALTDAEPVADLLETFQAEYGAQLLGSTVMRIRGFVYPVILDTFHFGVVGAIVENDDDLTQTEQSYGPTARPHDDWLMWWPYYSDANSVNGTGFASGNAQGSAYGVDVKSSRKIEELGQGLHLWRYTTTGGSPAVIQYDLSVGLKLP